MSTKKILLENDRVSIVFDCTLVKTLHAYNLAKTLHAYNKEVVLKSYAAHWSGCAFIGGPGKGLKTSSGEEESMRLCVEEVVRWCKQEKLL